MWTALLSGHCRPGPEGPRRPIRSSRRRAAPTRSAGWLALLALPALPLQGLAAQSVVSRFAGSVEKGVYETDYEALTLAGVARGDTTLQRVEGAMVSRVFLKPTEKSNLEVFRSYQRELEAGGFTVTLAGESGRDTELLVRSLYGREHTPGFDARPYQGTEGRVTRTDLARVGTQADYYLVANRSTGGRTRWVVVVLSRYDDLYMVEELTSAEMETGTVSLDLDALRAGIEESGKIAVYDIHFATGSARIEPSSEAALSVIATYLGQTSGAFYIVGHTDDTGTLEGNLELSEARAAAVKEALVSGHGVPPQRLETRGVGPLSPVSTNTGEAGRALNRRVEIVQRLPR